MRISTTSCLCPFLVCLCFIQRCYGASHHVTTKVPSKNQTKLANGETEVHHRPKRGWIWNQFFVLEEHMGTEAQYVGKVGCKKKKQETLWSQRTSTAYFAFFCLLVYWEMGCTRSKLFCWGMLCRHCTCFYYLLIWKFWSHLWRCLFFSYFHIITISGQSSF